MKGAIVSSLFPPGLLPCHAVLTGMSYYCCSFHMLQINIYFIIKFVKYFNYSVYLLTQTYLASKLFWRTWTKSTCCALCLLSSGLYFHSMKVRSYGRAGPGQFAALGKILPGAPCLTLVNMN